MALFIVLWLCSCPQDIQKEVGRYFRDPQGSSKKLGSSFPGGGDSVRFDQNLTNLSAKLQLAMRHIPDYDQIKGNIRMTVTGEGLRIELIETEKGMFFETGKSAPTGAAKELLIALANQLGQLPYRLVIEGHTDATPFGNAATYTNWELSADRANAARKLMQEHGLRPNQVIQISGYADRQLRVADQPRSPSNRRISIIVSCAHMLT